MKFTVIIPTLNAVTQLGRCLGSIRAQDVPQDQVEILVVDGGSLDGTISVALQHQAIVIDNPYKIAEKGKGIGLNKAHGKFVVFLDADNELTHTDIFSKAEKALNRQPEALGIESYYPSNSRMTSFCGYLTELLHISDPVSWMMASTPVLTGADDYAETWKFARGSKAYPLGANGFIYRRHDLLELPNVTRKFEDTVVAVSLSETKPFWLRLPGRGVYHYIVFGLSDFIRKRRRQTYHRLSHPQGVYTDWTQMGPKHRPIVAVMLCATLVLPLWQMIAGLVKDRDLRWLWHPLACLASVYGLVWGYYTFKTKPSWQDVEPDLQPWDDWNMMREKYIPPIVKRCVR